MNYQRLYDSIIEKRKFQIPDSNYVERHHILPRSLGGSDDESNIVALTAREHFMCHYLLIKIHKPNTRSWYKMINAFMIMNTNVENHKRYMNSRLYEKQRLQFSLTMSENQRGKKNSQHGTRWIYNLEAEEHAKIPLGDKIPEGWHEGRIVDFKRKKELLSQIDPSIDLECVIGKTNAQLERLARKYLKETTERDYYIELYNVFKKGNFKSIGEFIELTTDFPYSRQILIKNWRKHVGVDIRPKVCFNSETARNSDIF